MLARSFALLMLLLLLPGLAQAELRIRDVCRVKGQEENTLHGLGLVVGLKGSGDINTAATMRSLARMMDLMGTRVGPGKDGGYFLDELKDAKNVALVFVTATVPAAGGRQGDTLNVSIANANNAKSLNGGYLLLTPLLGPRPGSDRVYAFASGPLDLPDASQPLSARVHNGCRLEEDFTNVYTQDGKLTLVLDKNHASFQTAQDIADVIKNQPDFREGSSDDEIATAKDQVNIEVKIPSKYAADPVLFVSLILNQRLFNTDTEARVVVNERAGAIVIGANVEIGAVAVTHRNLVIDVGEGNTINEFVPLDPASNKQATKLQALVEALNAVKVPTSDIIEIIKGLDRNGQLYGKLIIE
ncbi:MAG TPA: flagellar basal body P-ring protein FlgI [Pirellulaceae bacterium]|nr:flagellar basal body P-ring protein FlgI [Pirellulaceae bacterium]